MFPVLVEDITDLQGDLTREANGVDVEDVQYYADQGSLGTTSIEAKRVRAAITEAQYHLPILQIDKDQSQEPLWNLQSKQDPHDDVVINFVEGFGPVSKQVDDSSRFAGVVCLPEDEVNY